MKKIIKNILIGTSITAIGITTTKNSWAGLLYHDYKIKTYYEKNDKKRENQDFMVLLHGIYGRNSAMESIAQYFKNDYRIVNIQYPTTKETVQEITELYIKPSIKNISEEIYEQNFGSKIKNQYFEINENRNREDIQSADKNLNQNIKINFVAHSMGTGVLRYYLKEKPLKNLGKVVFISPPSHGSHLADIPFVDKLQFILGKVVTQFSTQKDSFVNQLGEPDYDYLILIGNKTNNPFSSILIPGDDDGMVPLDSAKMESENFKIIENANHKSILKDIRTMEEISKFFKSSTIQKNTIKEKTENFSEKKE
ncbi:lipase family alpha/beta hydrolase [Leptotrichia sp. HSP-536]|uniref:Lipase family alpha/beta hydrolase n=1 Tax=Leptotrichia alba TaxID=3239304 RepID=A0AB39V171_9FUSO